MAERRIILVGKTGNGKSSIGNSILGRNAFVQKRSLVAVTQWCKDESGVSSINGLNYSVCDTPGLLDADVKLIDRFLEVQKSVKICPQPHAFLLVFSSLNRMTEDEKCTIDILRIMFGEKVFDHCIVVFTRGNEFVDDAEFDKCLRESSELGKLVRSCGNRVTRIENPKHFDHGIHTRSNIKRLLEMIEVLASRGHHVYNYKSLGLHTEVLKAHPQNDTGDIHLQLQELCSNIGRVVSREEWKPTLLYVGGAVAGGAVALAFGVARFLR